MKVAGGELSVSCSACHRSLKDPVSIAAHMGPVCRARNPKGEKADEGMMRAEYTFWLEPGFVLVVDQGVGRTVTNDAERVVGDLAKKVALAGRRILYQDTERTWDELEHDGNRFTRFAPVGVKGSYRDAIQAARPRAKPDGVSRDGVKFSEDP